MKASIKAIEKAIHDYNGNITLVALHLRVARNTIYNRIKTSERLQRVLQETRESKLDSLEDEAYKQAMSGNTALLIFLLKTQAKGRGYVERQEVQQDTVQKVVINWGDE